MTMRPGHRSALFAAILAGAITHEANGQAMRTFNAARQTNSERLLRATLDFGAGAVRFAPASPGQLYRMQVRYDATRYAPIQWYEPRTGILRLGLEPVGGGGIRVTSRNQLEQSADFALSATTPLALSVNLGASEADLDLGGLHLIELTLRGGATHGTVTFSRPTTGECREATFSVGATEIAVNQLANAGCAAIRVDGGVGRALLDFSGEWQRDAVVVVDLSMGAITLRIPRGTGVQLVSNRFLSTLSAEGFIKAGGTWTTPRFGAAAHKIRVELKTAMTGINVEWID